MIFHPSSGAHNTVSTVSGINETCTAYCYLSFTWLDEFSYSHVHDSVMSSWWWVKYYPKHVEQLTDLNKPYSVASCWIIIAVLYDARFIEHKIKKKTM